MSRIHHQSLIEFYGRFRRETHQVSIIRDGAVIQSKGFYNELKASKFAGAAARRHSLPILRDGETIGYNANDI